MNAALNVNIGQTVRRVITEKKISQAELGRILNTSSTYVTRLLKKETIDTNTLCELCKKLDYNFFEDFMPKFDFSDEEEYNAYMEIEERKLRRGFYLTYPHIGNRIMEWLKEIKVTQAELGERLGVTHQEVSRLLKNKSIDTGKLVQISVCLNYNFFSCFYNWYDDEETIEANKADGIMGQYLGVEKVFHSGTESITGLLSDPSLDKYRGTIKNICNLINLLYKENEELRNKLK